VSVRAVILGLVVVQSLVGVTAIYFLVAYSKILWAVPIAIFVVSVIAQLTLIRHLLPLDAKMVEVDGYMQKAASTSVGRRLQFLKWFNVVMFFTAFFVIRFL
jgi:hypothetical protein